VSMQVLHMSEASKELAEKTLVELRGSQYQIREKKRYKDTGKDLQSRFWVQDRDLIIKGCINGPSEVEEVPEGIKVLSAYGFHVERAKKALLTSGDDVGAAVEELGKTCFELSLSGASSSGEIQEALEDEKMALESIYSPEEFRIKIPGKIWELKLKLPYLLKYLPSASKTPQKKKDKSYDPFKDPKNCRFYFSGHCRYGSSCKKRHYNKNISSAVDD
ncbi:DEAH (AspGluAlaAsp/His) box polypeptide 57, partial [Caligus rogercresseyi]